MNLTRHEAIIKKAIMMGATVVGPRLLAGKFGQDANPDSPNFVPTHAPTAEPFSTDEIALLDEIGDTIIPPTNVPGAKAVGIGSFIAMMVTDCYYPNEQASFQKGLRRIGPSYEAKYHETFLTGTSENRTAFLNALDQEQQAYTAKQKERKTFIRENAT